MLSTHIINTLSNALQAIRERADAIKAAKMKIFVRRGGPNYVEGLAMMRRLGDEIGVAIEVYGPEASMTGICQKAIEYVKQFDTNGRH
jgi:ATP citrate (pro-S)-lyase